MIFLLVLNLIFLFCAVLISIKLKNQKSELDRVNVCLASEKNIINELFHNLDTAFWYIDLTTKKVRISSEIEKKTGYTQKNFEEDIHVWTKFVHPDDQKIVKRHLYKVQNGRADDCQFRIFNKNGEISWFESRCKPLVNRKKVVKLLGVAFDITDKKNVECKYKLMTENITDLFGITDEHGTIKYLSPSISKVLGYDPKEWEGTSKFLYIHPDDVGFVREAQLQMVDTKKETAVVFRYRHADGDYRYIESRAIPVFEKKGYVKNVVSVGRDITKNIEAEQSMKESWERYIHLQRSLDQFSKDLFGVMKVAELEARVIKEVAQVLAVTSIYTIAVDMHTGVQTISSGLDNNVIQDMLNTYVHPLEVCEVYESQTGYYIKLWEAFGKDYILMVNTGNQLLPPEKVWLKTLARYANVLYDNFRVIRELMDVLEHIVSKPQSPAWLQRLLFNLHENERKRLSQDLHDAALQEQIVWYRKLQELSTDVMTPEHLRVKLVTISEGMLDVIYQIRLTCNELRPPMLREFGLVASLKGLFQSTQLQCDYEILFESNNFDCTLNDDQLIGIYRIVQELLANATKHANADIVQLTLSSEHDEVQLSYMDNGVGMTLKHDEKTDRMGIYGIKERVRTLEGKIDIQSLLSEGTHVSISIPIYPSYTNASQRNV